MWDTTITVTLAVAICCVCERIKTAAIGMTSGPGWRILSARYGNEFLASIFLESPASDWVACCIRLVDRLVECDATTVSVVECRPTSPAIV